MDLERIEEILRTRPPRERTYDRRLPDLLVGRQPLKATIRLRGGSWFGSRAAAVVLVVVVVGGAALYGSWHQGQPVVSATPTATPTETPSQSSIATKTATASPPPSPSPSQSSSLPPQVYSTAPPAGSHHLLSGQVGFAGTWAWTVSGSGVSISQDGGRTWSDLVLPSGLKASSVMTVSAAPGRAVWLASRDGEGVRLYRKPVGATAWSSTALVPAWTPQESAVRAQGIERVTITPGPAGLVTVYATVGLGMSTADETLFVSTDDGRTFAQHRPTGGNIGMFWDSVTFVTPTLGLVVEGPSTLAGFLMHTSDGGTTWSNSSVPGLPAPGYYEYGSPAIVGSDIVVPLTTMADDTTTTFSLLVSHDGGATLAPMGTALTEHTGYSWFPSDTLGAVTWVTNGGTLYETSDGAQTWTSITPAGFGVSQIHLTGPTSAMVVSGQSGCASFKADCWSQSWLIETTDGGRTWTDL
jgi:photosystem II stability/assembly factor-like uncharacterized protein